MTIKNYLDVQTPILTALNFTIKPLIRAWEFSFEIYSHPNYSAFSLILKALQKIKSLIQPFFESLLELPFQGLKFFKDFTLFGISKIAKTNKKISIFFKFILLYKTPQKIKKNIKNRDKAIKTENEQVILDANLKSITLIGKCCKIPKIIYNFVDLTLGNKTPLFFKQMTKPFNFLYLFSFVSLYAKKRSLNSTDLLLDELKRVQYRALIELHAVRTNAPSTYQESLSNKALKAKIKAIKSELADNKALLDEIKNVAKRSFLQAASEKIQSNPSLIKTHFKISFEKNEVNFFAQLGKIDEKNLSEGLQNIKSRLNQKRNGDLCSLAKKITSTTLSVLEIVHSFGFVYLPLLPAMSLLSGAAILACGVNAFMEHRHKRAFKDKMQQIATCA